MIHLHLKSIAGLAVGACMAMNVAAAPVHFAGSGVWGSAVTPTAYSAANATFSFAFDLPNPVSSNPSTQITGFSYLLNGVSIGQTPTSITFYDSSSGGLFDINFGASNVQLLGAQVFNFTTNAISTGTYATSSMGLNNFVEPGSATVVISSATTVPEPASLALAALALAAMGAVSRRKSV